MAKDSMDVSEIRDLRCVPLAREVLKIIASQENLALGQKVSDSQRLRCYEPIYRSIIELFKQNNAALNDISYIFRLVLQGLQFTENLMQASMNQNLERASAKLWSLKEMDKLTINMVDDILLGNPQADLTEHTETA